MILRMEINNKVETSRFGNVTIGVFAELDSARDIARIETEAQKRGIKGQVTLEVMQNVLKEIVIDQMKFLKDELDEVDAKYFSMPQLPARKD